MKSDAACISGVNDPVHSVLFSIRFIFLALVLMEANHLECFEIIQNRKTGTNLAYL